MFSCEVLTNVVSLLCKCEPIITHRRKLLFCFSSYKCSCLLFFVSKYFNSFSDNLDFITAFQYACETNIDGGGWALVRRVAQGSSWHPAKDGLAGTEPEYGDYSHPTSDSTFNVPYSQFVKSKTEFLFTTGEYMLVKSCSFHFVALFFFLACFFQSSFVRRTYRLLLKAHISFAKIFSVMYVLFIVSLRIVEYHINLERLCRGQVLLAYYHLRPNYKRREGNQQNQPAIDR
jgi:hypothetical protein